MEHFCITTIITVFFNQYQEILPEVYNVDRVCEVGVMTEGIIPGTEWKKQLLLYLFPGYVKNLTKRN